MNNNKTAVGDSSNLFGKSSVSFPSNSSPNNEERNKNIHTFMDINNNEDFYRMPSSLENTHYALNPKAYESINKSIGMINANTTFDMANDESTINNNSIVILLNNVDNFTNPVRDPSSISGINGNGLSDLNDIS